MHRLGAEFLDQPGAAWRAATAWVVADGVEHVVVLRAHLLSPRVWARLLALAQRTGIDLLLVCHTRAIPPPLAKTLAGIPHRLLGDVPTAAVLHGLDEVRPDEPFKPAPSASDAADLPDLPATLVTCYRADAFRRLDPATFALVDAAYQLGWTRPGTGWVTTNHPPHPMT